jgi:hypothetical protein
MNGGRSVAASCENATCLVALEEDAVLFGADDYQVIDETRCLKAKIF